MAERSFARHETFHPRYGWFRKAYAFVADEGNDFNQEDAPVIIGVGKNMVRSIRSWGLAAKLIVKSQQSRKPRTPSLVPTRRGRALFGEQGWDPYMEDPGTLWLLHWLLLAPPTQLPVWWLAFNEFHAVEFEDTDLEEAISTHLEAVATWRPPHPSSVKKDISALVRTYAPAPRSDRAGIDDVLVITQSWLFRRAISMYALICSASSLASPVFTSTRASNLLMRRAGIHS